MTLQRVPGNPIIVEMSLVFTWSDSRADPNEYYQILGLSPNKAWGMDDIRNAFRDKMKIYHPDGSNPDSKLYEKCRTAYEVLNNPDTRHEYDSMNSNQRWIDQRLLHEIVSKLSRSKDIDLKKIATKKLSEEPEDRPVKPINWYFDNWAHYYDTEEAPGINYVNSWVDRVRRIAWDKGVRGNEVKLGFTDGESFILAKPWGRVIMIGRDSDKVPTLVGNYFDGESDG